MAAAAGGAAGLAALLGSASPHLLIVSAAEEPAGSGHPDADLLLFATPQPARPGAAPRRPALGRPPVTPGGRDGEGAARGRGRRSPGPCGLRRGRDVYPAALCVEPCSTGPPRAGLYTGPGGAVPRRALLYAATPCHAVLYIVPCSVPSCAMLYRPCRAIPCHAAHLPSPAAAPETTCPGVGPCFAFPSTLWGAPRSVVGPPAAGPAPHSRWHAGQSGRCSRQPVPVRSRSFHTPWCCAPG